MAISIIGAGTYATGGGNLTPTIHASTAENDLLIAFSNKRAGSDKLVPPGGWSTLYQHPQTATNGNASEMTFYGKFAGASESSPTFTATGTTAGSVQVLTVRGNFSATIGDVFSVGANAGAATNSAVIHYPTLTVSAANSLVLYGGKYRESVGSTATVNTISGFTQIAQVVADTGSTALLTTWNYQLQTAATSISSGSWTVTNPGLASSTNAAIAASIVETAEANFELDTDPLYYGETRLDDKTNLIYAVTDGHDNLTGELVASGTTGTTNGSGVFQLAAPITGGAANDPVMLHLYWEEGNPAVDRSLIVKTTLVAA